MKVTVGLICYNELLNIDGCLKSILSPGNLEQIHQLIIVDNASTDGTLEKLQAWTRNHSHLITLIESDQNRIGRARQMVVDHCETELLLFTDADCIVPPDWIIRHLEHLEEDVVGVCGPNRLPEAHHWQKALSHFMSSPLGHGGSPQAMLPKAPVFVSHLPTTNALFRVSAIRKTKGFKSHLMVGEDAELGNQLRRLGLKMKMHPTPLVVNQSADTFREWLLRMYRFGGAQWIHSRARSFLILLLSPLWVGLSLILAPKIFLVSLIHLSKKYGVKRAFHSTTYGFLSHSFYLLGFFTPFLTRRVSKS